MQGTGRMRSQHAPSEMRQNFKTDDTEKDFDRVGSGYITDSGRQMFVRRSGPPLAYHPFLHFL